MKTRVKQQKTERVNLPELKNPINSSAKKESFNGTQSCFTDFIGYHKAD